MKKFVGLWITLLSICLCGMCAYASTSEALDTNNSIELVQSINGAQYRAPYVASESGTEQINPMSGALNLKVTDLVLPGKNGLDLVISRTYNSQLMENNYSLKRGLSQSGKSKMYAYKYTYDGNKSCYILFASEQEMLECAKDSFVGRVLTDDKKETIIDSNFNEDAYLYKAIANQNGGVTYTRVASSKIVLNVEVQHQEFTQDKSKNFPDFSLDQGWTLDMPSMFAWQKFLGQEKLLESGKKYNSSDGQFRDENGQIFSTQESYIKEMVSNDTMQVRQYSLDVELGCLYEGYEKKADTGEYFNENDFDILLTDEYGNEVIYDRYITYIPTNTKYYFNSDGLLVAKQNQLGNSILYHYQDKKLKYIIDSYNRYI